MLAFILMCDKNFVAWLGRSVVPEFTGHFTRHGRVGSSTVLNPTDSNEGLRVINKASV